ncbi:hypothetical protein D3C83_291490 [compost metagenome]
MNVPGFDLASATSSFTFFAGSDGCTIRMFGMSASGVMPAKSLTGSNGSFAYSVALIAWLADTTSSV